MDIFLSAPTIEARAWCDEYLYEPARRGQAYVIEPRYVLGIIAAL